MDPNDTTKQVHGPTVHLTLSFFYFASHNQCDHRIASCTGSHTRALQHFRRVRPNFFSLQI